MATALRADAARNLELIVEAAEAAFAEEGHEASVADIARRAGVGQATLFRRFETKNDLIRAVFRRKLEQLLAAARAAARKESAWDGLTTFMATGTQLHVRDRGFFQGMAHELLEDPEIMAVKLEVLAAVTELVERAKAEGTLRADVAPEDIPALCCAAAQATTIGNKPRAWKHYLAVITDGMRARA